MSEIIKVGSKKSTLLTEAHEIFIRYKTAIGVSEDTVRDYTTCFKHIKKCYGEEITCGEINEDTYIMFLEYLRNLNLSGVTISTYAKECRTFFNYLINKNYTDHFKMVVPKPPEVVKIVYTDTEIQKLIEYPKFNGKTDFYELIGWAAVTFIMGTSFRLSTAANAKIDVLDFANETISLVVQKTKKVILIPMSESLKEAMKEYLKHRKGEQEDYLFCSPYGERLHKRTLAKYIANYNKKRGVEKTSVHLFRHTFAKNWIMSGGDILRLQRILGHSSLHMVKNYVSLFGNDLKSDFDKFNVLDRITNKNKTEKVSREKITVKNYNKNRKAS
jgi:Site-specific recombinase XerD